MKNRNLIDLISVILLLAGGLNWGFIGLFDIDVIGTLFGDMSSITRVVFVLIGVSALYRMGVWLKSRG